jgi:hypothetical protein
MALPGSYDYTASASTIIDTALKIIGVLPEGVSASSTQQTDVLVYLNMMIKSWMADDLQMWVAQRGTLFPALNQKTFQLGSASGNDRAVSTYFKTTLTVAAVATDLTITVSSATNISNGDAIGIILDTGDIHWTSVNGAPVGSVVTITDAMPSGAATSNIVFSYAPTALIQRPQKLLELWRHVDDGTADGTTGTDIPIRLISREEYDERPYKAAQGLAVEAFYNPLNDGGPGASNGELQIWPEFNDLTTLMQFRYVRPLQNVDGVANDVDFPQEWYLALTWNLAYLLSAPYGVPLQDRYILRKDAEAYKQQVLNYSMEDTSVFLRPDYVAEQGF